LTITANALRVGDHLLERLGARTARSASIPRIMQQTLKHPVLTEMAATA